MTWSETSSIAVVEVKLEVIQMSDPGIRVSSKPIVAFGPEMNGFGSWDWVGSDMAEELNSAFTTLTFSGEVPACDIVVFVKFKPPLDVLEQVSRRAAVVYAPVDFYGAAAEIDGDYRSLNLCDLILVHCERLARYFSAYARVQYVDHHLKFQSRLRESYREEGPLLWVGVRSNLPPLAEWVNRHGLPGEMWLLTNPAEESRPLVATDYGFQDRHTIRIETWAPTRHLEWLSLARAAIDIKGDDFRSRHKPPAKALDFIASGIPLAMNGDSSSAQYLADRGFQLANVRDPEHWLSCEYWEQTLQFGRTRLDQLNRRQIGLRWRQFIECTLSDRATAR